MKTTLDTLREKAAESMSQFPQYNGKFDSFQLCRMRRNIRTKMGHAFDKDEITIYDPNYKSPHECFRKNDTCAWSFRNTCLTVIQKCDIGLKGC